MKLSELPDDFTPEQFMRIDREGLDQVPYELKKWRCQAKGCCNGTKVRDYGILPWVWAHRNSQYSYRVPQAYWVNVSTHFNMCAKHLKMFKRLVKQFDFRSVYDKLMDPFAGIESLETIQKIETVKQIEGEHDLRSK